MLNRWAGLIVTALIVIGVVAILLMNLNPVGSTAAPNKAEPSQEPSAPKKAGKVQEYPIGDEVLKNHMRIAAVWLPSIAMEGMPGIGGTDVIHVEADIHATEGNPNGFALDEFIPYLKIAYKIVPASGGKPIHEGDMMPMVAADGLHYGVSVAMPKAGEYRLIYDIKPPSDGGLGRHVDPATGVAPWWEPFQVSFEWDYPGPSGRKGTESPAK